MTIPRLSDWHDQRRTRPGHRPSPQRGRLLCRIRSSCDRQVQRYCRARLFHRDAGSHAQRSPPAGSAHSRSAGAAGRRHRAAEPLTRGRRAVALRLLRGDRTMLKDALAGFRCVDFSWVFAGPYCGQLLGDLGMEMIKIESRKRMDVVRNYPPFAFDDRRVNSSGYWNTHNRSKYSVNLDMKSEKAREIVTRLVAMSDVVLENFSARGMKAIGFDYDRLREINPRIVYCSMAGFGHRGPYKNYVAYGPMQESQAGIVHLTGWPDGDPSRVGTSYPDASGGVTAAFSIVSALRIAKRTGKGQWIDLAQTLTAAALTNTAVIEYTVNGDIQQRNGDYH